ncbi:MAG: hypothetical protein ABI193_16160, partial [Minicystis sp.]
MPRRASLFTALSLLLQGCFFHAETPAVAPLDARGGHAPPHFDRAKACTDWSAALGPEGDAARSHASFPELDPQACFTSVRYGADGPSFDP